MLLAEAPVDALAEQVGVPVVAGVLLDHVDEKLPQRDRLTLGVVADEIEVVVAREQLGECDLLPPRRPRLYVAYLDCWPTRQRIWPWTTALIGLGVSVAGNIGHIQAEPGQPVILADRLTAATSPLAAFAGLSVGLLVVKMTRQRTNSRAREPETSTTLVLAPQPPGSGQVTSPTAPVPVVIRTTMPDDRPEDGERDGADPHTGLLRDATAICQHAAARGERLSQRALAQQLRATGRATTRPTPTVSSPPACALTVPALGGNWPAIPGWPTG
jgi:hypothetical protein